MKSEEPSPRPAGNLLKWIPLAAVPLVVALGLWVWVPFGHPARPPDILLISVDTLRADRLGCYGYRGIDTPNIDGLAAGGVLFESAMAPSPLTGPSHASMLTGLIPPHHGVHVNTAHVLPDTV